MAAILTASLIVGSIAQPSNVYNACRGSLRLNNPSECENSIRTSVNLRASAGSSYSLRAIDFGADPTGQTDSSRALQSMIETAWNSSRGFIIGKASGMPDFGGLVMDLTGGHYRLDRPLQFPSLGGGNAVFANGALHASTAFPTDSYLLQLTSIPATAGHFGRYRYWTFRNLELDGNGTAAGGVALTQAEEMRFEFCLFTGYTQTGLLSYGSVNELFVTHCWFRELNDYNQCHNDTLKTGTGLTLYNNDHSLDNVVIFCTRRGVVTNSSAVIYRNMHIYTEANSVNMTCFYLQSTVRMTRIEMSYLDGCAIMIDNPGSLQLNNNFFLLGRGMQASGGLVVLRSVTEDNFRIQGFQLKNNVVGGHLTEPTSLVKLDQQLHTFSSIITDTIVDDNIPRVTPDLSLPTTRRRWTASFTNTSKLSVEVASQLLFKLGPGTHVLYSVRYEQAEDMFVQHALLPIVWGDTNVTVVTEKPVTQAILSLYVDQSQYT